jgi:hypothetical protein
MMLLHLGSVAIMAMAPTAQDQGDEVPVTIKELDIEGAIAEFRKFQGRLEKYREDIGKGRESARETGQILEELRATATADNGWNETKILETVAGYVDTVLAKQVGLVDFLESQRYRISHYASQMASSVRPEDLALLFGTVEQNDQAIRVQVANVGAAQTQVADLVDSFPKEWIDRESFRPTRTMPADARKQLNLLLYRYQQSQASVEFAKKRLELLKAAKRNQGLSTPGAELNIDADLLVGQMFGALDQVRLQMSMDFLFLEQLLTNYTRSARTQDILDAFQSLVELQGDLDGPSPELSGVLDWLQDSSTRRLVLGAKTISRSAFPVKDRSVLLREAYTGARGGTGTGSGDN